MRWMRALPLIFCCTWLLIACSAGTGAEVAVPEGMRAPHRHVEWSDAPEIATLDAVAAQPLACDGRFDLRLRFQGLSHLVSPRTGSAEEIWVLFPKTDGTGVDVPQGLPDDVHEPMLFFAADSVRLSSGLRARKPTSCGNLPQPCAGLTFTGAELSVRSGAVGSGVAMDWGTGTTTSLRQVPDFDALTRQSLGNAAPPASFSRHVAPTGAQRELAGRFRGTAGRLVTAELWPGSVHVRKPNATKPALRKIARAFELVVPIAGCATLAVHELSDQAERGTITVGSPDGSDVTLIVDHAPRQGCRYHFHNHYRLRNLGGDIHRTDLVGIEVPGQQFCGNAQCSPGCSEGP